jgi:SAM-dependent methyltransferase
MSAVREREVFLRRFHDAHPGITSRALARAGSYERLAARAPAGDVLDLACGDGSLLRLLGPRAVGIDLSRRELAAASVWCTGHVHVVQARAQELPFADRSFDAATCHLAFMLFDEIDAVVAELARVLRPGARFLALLGGGPSAEGDDAFHRFAQLMPPSDQRFGDRRASTQAGWRELFGVDRPGGWRDLAFERWPLELGGRFDDVWRFLGASYQLTEADRVRDELRAAFPGEHVPCTVVTYLATVTR